MALPSAPAAFTHSSVMVLPMLANSFFSASDGSATVMPLAASSFRYSLSRRSLDSQPRFSAAAAAFSTASCRLLSRLSKAFWLTTVALRGSQAFTG